MSGFEVGVRDWVDFGRTYVGSEAFRTLFRDGMALVEETAAYLDGDGREESRAVSAEASLGYAAESMRLTTTLMQVASWLLVQRAVAEGEMTPAQAQHERNRVRLTVPEAPRPEFDALPARLQDLAGRARRLHARILHLDGLIREGGAMPTALASPVAAQQGLLRSAFPAGPT